MVEILALVLQYDEQAVLSIASLPYLPASTIPMGLNASGLPVGAEVIGPEFSDDRCIQIVHLIEQAVGGCARPPGFA